MPTDAGARAPKRSSRHSWRNWPPSSARCCGTNAGRDGRDDAVRPPGRSRSGSVQPHRVPSAGHVARRVRRSWRGSSRAGRGARRATAIGDMLQEVVGQAVGRAAGEARRRQGVRFCVETPGAPRRAPEGSAARLSRSTSATSIRARWSARGHGRGADAGDAAREPSDAALRCAPGGRGRAPERCASPALPANLDVILDIDLPLSVRFGQTDLSLEALTRLGPGSVIDLGRSPDDPVDVLVNGRLVARAEVVVVGGNYGVRILEVVSAADRVAVARGRESAGGSETMTVLDCRGLRASCSLVQTAVTVRLVVALRRVRRLAGPGRAPRRRAVAAHRDHRSGFRTMAARNRAAAAEPPPGATGADARARVAAARRARDRACAADCRQRNAFAKARCACACTWPSRPRPRRERHPASRREATCLAAMPRGDRHRARKPASRPRRARSSPPLARKYAARESAAAEQEREWLGARIEPAAAGGPTRWSATAGSA